ncbi:MAG: hypothetical protein EXR75_03355 [Myxococcales bacterium]|nr:hypothetical protein [Myxococcales bacterium]
MRIGILIFVLSTTALISGSAFGDGALVRTSSIPRADLVLLERSIATAKASDVGAFTELGRLRAELPALDANKRGRLASVTPQLRGLGTRALMPMLQELAVASPGRGDLSRTAWLAWRVNLLEAVGALRDARSTTVLEAVMASAIDEHEVTVAAAQALGKLGTQRAAKMLVALSDIADKKRLGVLAGMGHCRRQLVAERLATLITSTARSAEVEVLARSLGDVGNAWAWQTPIIAANGDESAVRATAADALIQAFRQHNDAVSRAAITEAVLVVDDPSTPALIAEARSSAAPPLALLLDALALRFQKSPLHRH